MNTHITQCFIKHCGCYNIDLLIKHEHFCSAYAQFISEQQLLHFVDWWGLVSRTDLFFSFWTHAEWYIWTFWLTVCVVHCRGPGGWKEANLPHPLWLLQLHGGAARTRPGDGVHRWWTVSHWTQQGWILQRCEDSWFSHFFYWIQSNSGGLLDQSERRSSVQAHVLPALQQDPSHRERIRVRCRRLPLHSQEPARLRAPRHQCRRQRWTVFPSGSLIWTSTDWVFFIFFICPLPPCHNWFMLRCQQGCVFCN